MLRGTVRTLVGIFLLVTVWLTPVWADATATLTGRVFDPQGLAVPGAEVEAINVGTGVRYHTVTNNSGYYAIPALPPSIYRIIVDKTGFKQIVKTDVTLHVEDVVSANFNLVVGSTSETVTVNGGGINLDTADATLSTTVDRNFAENLPLNGRSFQTLILLTPGTVLDSNGNSGGTFSVNGQRNNTNNFTVDGVSVNLGGLLAGVTANYTANGANPDFTLAGTTQGMVSVDALEEFKIQTSTYAPEFGRQPGGQVSMLTRSGTNAFHGTAFDYLRNTVFDANNWFNGFEHDPALPKGAERQNDFGGTFGGPIFRDKTFFFFTYEGLRLLVPFTQNYTVPSMSLRQQAASSFLPILNSFPLPNGSVSGNSGVFTLDASTPTNFDVYAIKLDHRFGERLHVFGRYSDTKSNNQTIQPGGAPFQQFASRAITVGADFAKSPVFNNEVRLNYTVNPSTQSFRQLAVGGSSPYDDSILFPAPFSSRVDFANFALFLPGLFRLSFAGHLSDDSQRQINVVDNVSYTVGTHHLRWGVDYRRLFPILRFEPGFLSYRVQTLTDLQNGNITQLFYAANATEHPIFTNFSAYGQDTWQATRRLSLTYGLRWELNPTPGERDGLDRFILNVIGIDNPATARLAPVGSPIYKTQYHNFAPRIGVAYQIAQSPRYQTVMRAGIGSFYDLNSQTVAQGYFGDAFGNNPAPLLQVPFPAKPNFVTLPSVPAPVQPPYFELNAIDPQLQLPYTLQWNLSIEQALGESQSLTASYVAAAGRRLLRQDTIENFGPVFQNLQVLRNASSSNYQALQLQFKREFSRHTQALFSYTYSHSIDNASDGQTTVTSFPVLPNPNQDRGSSNFDLRHAVRGALMYEIPTWKATALSRALLGGWSIDAIGLAQTAPPLDTLGGFTQLGQVRADLVPGQSLYLYGAQCTSVMQGLGELLPGSTCPGGKGLNPNAFAAPPTDSNGNALRQGTLGRNVLRGFGAWQADFAVHRVFSLTEKMSLQFRAEFFNVFNHPNLTCCSTTVGDSQFGLAGGTLNQTGSVNSLYQIGGPRSGQFALKLVF